MVSSQLELHRYATGRKSRVITALTMFKTHLFGYVAHVIATTYHGAKDPETFADRRSNSLREETSMLSVLEQGVP